MRVWNEPIESLSSQEATGVINNVSNALSGLGLRLHENVAASFSTGGHGGRENPAAASG